MQVVPSRPKKTLKSYSRVQYLSDENRANLIRKGQNVAYMFENDEEVEPVNIGKPNFTPEVHRSVLAAGLKTPNRPTRSPWGKFGSLPSEAPPRRPNSRSRKSSRSRSRSRSRKNSRT